MAITLLNEFEYTGAQGASNLLSPFMRPCLYFKVEGDGSITDPEAILDLNGTTEDLQFDCTYLGVDANNDYLFHLDLTDIIRYLMRSYDGTLKPDDIDLKSTHGLTLFDEYFLDWSNGAIAYLYFEKGTANEDYKSLTPIFIYLAGQLPRISGFNLYDVLFCENLKPLKWSANTYNSIFIWLRNATTTISNVTDPSDVRTLYSGTPAAEGYYQFKFPKYADEVALFRGLNTIRIANTGMTTVDIEIYYDPDCETVDVLFQHPVLGYVSFPFNGASVENMTFKKGGEFDRFLTTLVNISELKEITGYEGQKKINITGKVDSEYWPVVQELHGSRHVFLHIGSKAHPVNLITALNNDGYETLSSSGIKIISAINTSSTAYVRSGQFAVFNGEVITVIVYLVLNSGEAPYANIDDLGGLGDISNDVQLAAGLNVIDLTTTAAAATARVRIFNNNASNFKTSDIIAYRDSEIVKDTAINWLKCEVAGGSSLRSNHSREQVSAELVLPEHFNVKF